MGSGEPAAKGTARSWPVWENPPPFLLAAAVPLAPQTVPAPPSRAAGESQGSTPLPGMRRARGQDIYAKVVKVWKRGGEGRVPLGWSRVQWLLRMPATSLPRGLGKRMKLSLSS